MRNNVNAIEFAFDVKAFGKDKKSTVIDVTDFINADNDIVSFDTRYKKGFRVGGFQKDKSFVNFVKSEIYFTRVYIVFSERLFITSYIFDKKIR